MGRTRRELLRDGAGLGAAALIGGGALGGRSAAAAAAAAAKAPYAAGFTSLKHEVRLPRLDVDGTMPSWLRGVLVRNGPALFEIGEQQFNHWFDGLAMLHGFAFGRGRVSYANRFLRSSAYDAWKTTGKMTFSEFGTDPCRAIFSGVTTLPVLGAVPNANVSIEHLGDRFRALTELPVPVRFDRETMRTLGADGSMPTGRLGTAHPHQDHKTGERFSYEVELIPPAAGLRIVVEKGGRRRELAFVPQDRPGYLHSFGLTDRYVAVFTQPFGFDLAKFLSPTRGPIVTNYEWDGAQPARIVLVDRAKGGVAATVEVDPFFVFHNITAFDDARGRVVIDVCAHEDDGIVDALYLKNLRRAGARVPQAVPRRITIDPATARAELRDLAEGNFELPRTDYATVNRREYRYAYGVGVKDPARSGFIDRVSKLDIKRGELAHWQERGAYSGRAGLRPPSGPVARRGRRRPAVGRARRVAQDLLPAGPRRARPDRDRPRERPPSHPVRVPRVVRRVESGPCRRAPSRSAVPTPATPRASRRSTTRGSPSARRPSRPARAAPPRSRGGRSGHCR